MGGGASLPLAVGDSLVEPGKPSIVSDPIPHDYDVLLAEVLASLKYPVAPHLEAVLKERKIVEGASPDEFEVTVILDAKKLTEYGYGNEKNPALDKIQSHSKVKMDRAKRCLESSVYKERWADEEPELLFSTCATFTKDPLQIDYYWTMPDGERKADEATLGVLQGFLNGAMQALADRKVVIKLDSSKHVLTCDPIDESVVTYEPLFDAMVGFMKAPPIGNPVVEEISEEKFKVTYPEANSYSVYSVSKEKGTIVGELYSADGTRKLSTTHHSLSKSPLVLESYTEAQGEKTATEGGRRLFQGLVDASVAKATSGWGLGIF